MSAKSILTTLQTTLAAIQTTYPWERLPVDANGNVTVQADSYFVHMLVSANNLEGDFDAPVFDLDVQVDSWDQTQGGAFDNLATANTSLEALGWRLEKLRILGSEPGDGYFGVAGTFQAVAAFEDPA